MDLTHLRQVIAIAETGSISRAAERLFITQPALSRSLAAFEARHGVRLFDRDRKGVTPTAAGRLVIEQGRALLFAATGLEDSLSDYKQGKLSRIFIGFRPLLASMILPRLATSMLQGGAIAQLAVSIGSPFRLTEQLLDDRLEFCIGNSDQFESPDVVARGIGSIPFALIVRAGHPLADRADLLIRDLADFPIVDSSNRFGDYYFNTDLPGVICDNHDILRTVALGSDAIWVSSSAFVQKEIRQGTLCVLDVCDLKFEYSRVSVISHKARTLSPAANHIIAQVETILRDMRDNADAKAG